MTLHSLVTSRAPLPVLLFLSLLTGISACEGELDEQRYKPTTPYAEDMRQGIQEELDASSVLDASRDDASPAAPEDLGEEVDLTTPSPDDLGQRAQDASPDMISSGDMPPALEDMAQPPLPPGCRGPAGLSDGEQTFTLEDRARRYILRLPKNYSPDRAWPIVLALHGNGGNTGYWDTLGGDRDMRTVLEERAILVVAEAIDRQWRDYNADPSTWPARVESELLYFDHILDTLRQELCVDEARIFAMGFSGGGSFSGVLGCRRQEIRAIAVGGSVIYFDPADCINTPAAWITIGAGEQAQGRTDYLEFFRDRAGCQATSTPTTPSPCVAYDGCDLDTPVHYCEHSGAHVWPSLGTQASWDFFSQF